MVKNWAVFCLFLEQAVNFEKNSRNQKQTSPSVGGAGGTAFHKLCIIASKKVQNTEFAGFALHCTFQNGKQP